MAHMKRKRPFVSKAAVKRLRQQKDQIVIRPFVKMILYIDQ